MTFENFTENHNKREFNVVHGVNSASWPMLVRIYNSLAMLHPEQIEEYVEIRNGTTLHYDVIPNPYRAKAQPKQPKQPKDDSKAKAQPKETGTAKSEAGKQVDGAAKEETAANG